METIDDLETAILAGDTQEAVRLARGLYHALLAEYGSPVQSGCRCEECAPGMPGREE